jgi:mRNA m6A methyltransferase catalytic subunit
MTDDSDALRSQVSAALYSLLSSAAVSSPISSLNLLANLISSSVNPPPLRLYELSRFDSILESLSVDWDHGTIILSHDKSGLTIMEFKLAPQAYNGSKKRKRPVDEEAESDSEADREHHERVERRNITPTVSSLSNLSKEMKEVYSILQRPTAKGKLLAEKVCLSGIIYQCTAQPYPSFSTGRMIETSNLYVLI